MDRDDLNVLSAFMAVAEERSFTKAARRLGVSQSALSHAIRGLEEEIGVRLLARTTRSVAPTEAGDELLRALRPALSDVRAALGKLAGMRGRPAGRVRLIVSPLAASSVLGPKLGQFARTYPDVVLDITTDESRVDLVAGGYDAGIHYGEFIEQDMVAVRVSPDHRAAIVGSPEYFHSHPRPRSPRDLLQHRCINFRHDRDEIYRWDASRSPSPNCGDGSDYCLLRLTVAWDVTRRPSGRPAPWRSFPSAPHTRERCARSSPSRNPWLPGGSRCSSILTSPRMCQLASHPPA